MIDGCTCLLLWECVSQWRPHSSVALARSTTTYHGVKVEVPLTSFAHDTTSPSHTLPTPLLSSKLLVTRSQFIFPHQFFPSSVFLRTANLQITRTLFEETTQFCYALSHTLTTPTTCVRTSNWARRYLSTFPQRTLLYQEVFSILERQSSSPGRPSAVVTLKENTVSLLFDGPLY